MLFSEEVARYWCVYLAIVVVIHQVFGKPSVRGSSCKILVRVYPAIVVVIHRVFCKTSVRVYPGSLVGIRDHIVSLVDVFIVYH